MTLFLLVLFFLKGSCVTPLSPSVRAVITYRVNDGMPHWELARDIDDDEVAEGGLVSAEAVDIGNGRSKNLTLETAGFELFAETVTSLSTSDFYDSETVATRYYPEVASALKAKLKCSHVHVFSHSVRNRDRVGEGDIQGYGLSAHVDVAPSAAAEIFAGMVRRAEQNYPEKNLRRGRCLLVNAWRNIDHLEPVRSMPLALLDSSTVVAPDDFVTFNLETDQYRVVQYRLGNFHKKRHRWYYFPKMTSDELLVFKQWDSDVMRPVRTCFHTAFDNGEKVLRQSIEVRALCFFPDHEPDTCPDVEQIYQDLLAS